MQKRVGALIIATVALASCAPSKARGVKGGPADAKPDFKILASDNRFHPDDIGAAAGDEITFEVENTGNVDHELTFDGLDVGTGDLDEGDVVHGRLVVPAGTTRFYCRYHGGMEGTIEGLR